MGESDRPFAAGDHGRFGDLIQRPLPPGLVIQFIPSLAAILARAEQLAGRSLTADEVHRVRDNCMVVASDSTAANAVEEARGYEDVDPADPWRSWQAIRLASE